MRLTDHTDYSLRVLMTLNRSKEKRTLSELSESLKISRNNLIKVSNQLTKLGFIESTRGPSGGVWIKEKTGRLSLKDIVSQTEEQFNIADCFNNKASNCTMLKGCLLKKSLNNALQAFLESLDEVTLNDVT